MGAGSTIYVNKQSLKLSTARHVWDWKARSHTEKTCNVDKTTQNGMCHLFCRWCFCRLLRCPILCWRTCFILDRGGHHYS